MNYPWDYSYIYVSIYVFVLICLNLVLVLSAGSRTSSKQHPPHAATPPPSSHQHPPITHHPPPTSHHLHHATRHPPPPTRHDPQPTTHQHPPSTTHLSINPSIHPSTQPPTSFHGCANSFLFSGADFLCQSEKMESGKLERFENQHLGTENFKLIMEELTNGQLKLAYNK